MAPHSAGSTTREVTIAGDLDVFVAARLRRHLRDQARDGVRCVRLDLSGVAWANASALRHLALTRRDLATASGLCVEVVAPSAAVVRMGARTRLAGVLGCSVA